MALDPGQGGPGGQAVQCPQCQQVVAIPDEAAPSPSLQEPELKLPPAADAEDIFTAAKPADDDLFGGVPVKPVVEVPAEPPVPAGGLEPLEPKPVGWEPAPAGSTVDSRVMFVAPNEGPPTSPGPADAAAALPVESATAATAFTDHSDASAAESLPAAPPVTRRGPRRSMLGPMLLVFLIPYAIVTTAYIGWQIYHQSKRFDPLERLPDPKPDQGGAKRIHPHTPLPAKLKTSLGQPLRVGDVEATALRVETSAEGQLALWLKLRNVSQDVEFNPVLPKDSYRFDPRHKPLDAGPYTYLEVSGGKRLYVVDGEWKKSPLQPGEEMTAVFRIGQDHKAAIRAARAAGEPLLWRVQLRRGLVPVGDKEVSATVVIGIEFSPRAVGSEAGEVAHRPAPSADD